MSETAVATRDGLQRCTSCSQWRPVADFNGYRRETKTCAKCRRENVERNKRAPRMFGRTYVGSPVMPSGIGDRAKSLRDGIAAEFPTPAKAEAFFARCERIAARARTRR